MQQGIGVGQQETVVFLVLQTYFLVDAVQQTEVVQVT